MPHNLEANSALEYVHLTYTGIVEFSERLQAKDEVFEMCFDKNYHRALVDLSESDIQMSETDAIKFASSFKEMERPKGYRLACIIGPNNNSDSLIEIIISIEGVNVKYFYDFKEAEEWLTAI